MRVVSLLAAGALLSASAALLAQPAAAQNVTGELRCSVKGGFGFLVVGSRPVTCTYRRPGQPTEFYTGQTSNIGIDLGPTNAIVATYKVLGADPLAPAALQGEFAGPGLGVAANAGFAGNVLVGGAGGATLLPVPNLETTAYTGFNVEAGLNRLQLQFAAVEEVPNRSGRRHRAQRDLDLQ